MKQQTNTSLFITRNISALCLSGLLYWGVDYKLNYVFWLGTLMFFAMANISIYFQNKMDKLNGKKAVAK